MYGHRGPHSFSNVWHITTLVTSMEEGGRYIFAQIIIRIWKTHRVFSVIVVFAMVFRFNTLAILSLLFLESVLSYL